jgi:hypothetical protein
MSLGRPVVGSAYVEIRPDTAGFEASLTSGVGRTTQNLGNKLSVPVKADTSQWEADWQGATNRLKERIGKVLEYSGIFYGGKAAIDTVKSGFEGLISTEQQAHAATLIFGQNGGKALADWADHAITAMGKTQGEALTTADTLGAMLGSFGGESGTKLVSDTENLTQRIADVASAKGKAVADVEAAVQAMMGTGRTQGVHDLGIRIDDADITAMAEKMGMIAPKVDTNKVNLLKAQLASLQQDIQKASQGGDPRTITMDTERLRQAENARGEDLKKFGQVRLTTEMALQAAQKKLSDDQASSIPDRVRINELKAREADLQQQISDASAGTLDTLSASQKAMAAYAVFMQKTTDATGQFGQTTRDKLSEAAATWHTAEESLADGMLPQLERLSSWETAHGGDLKKDFKEVGDFLGTAAGYAGDLIGWFSDHPDVAKGLGLAVASIFVERHVKSWGNTVIGVFHDAEKVWNTTLGKIGLPTFGLPNKTPGPVGGLPGTVVEDAAGVRVFVTNWEMMRGGPGGLPGTKLPAEPIPATPGSPISKLPSPLQSALAILPPVAYAVDLSLDPKQRGKYDMSQYRPKGTNAPAGDIIDTLNALGANSETGLGAAEAKGQLQRYIEQEQAGMGKLADIVNKGDLSSVIQLQTYAVAHKWEDLANQLDLIAGQTLTNAQDAAAIINGLELSVARTAQTAQEHLAAAAGSDYVPAVQLGPSHILSHAAGYWADRPEVALIGDAADGQGEGVFNATQVRALARMGIPDRLSPSFGGDAAIEQGRDPETASLLRQLIAEVQALRAAQGVGRGLTQNFNGFGMAEVAQVAAREAQRVYRAVDDNRAAGRPPFSGMRAY